MICLYLKAGDKCDACDNGIMQRKDQPRKTRDGAGRASQQAEEIFCNMCGHKHIKLDLYDYQGSRDLGLNVREPGHKRAQLETKIRDNREHRFSRKPSGALQIAWDGGVLTHIHCKVCDNSWKRKEGGNYDLFFNVQKDDRGIYTINCKKCGRVYQSG